MPKAEPDAAAKRGDQLISGAKGIRINDFTKILVVAQGDNPGMPQLFSVAKLPRKVDRGGRVRIAFNFLTELGVAGVE